MRYVSGQFVKNARAGFSSVIGGLSLLATSGCLLPPGEVFMSLATGNAAETEEGIALAADYRLANETDAIVLTAESNLEGSIYYAVFSSDPGTLTASAVKTWAGTAPSGSLVAAGEVPVSPGDVATELDTTISALPDKTHYTVFAVAEGPEGLADDADVRKFSRVLPRKLSQQNYASAIAGGGLGMTIRYSVYFPQGYYDDPDAEFPLLVYLGGAGEVPSSAGNAETIFTTGQYRINKTPYPANIALGQEYPFIIVVPQCNGALFNCTAYAETAWTHEVITNVESLYRVDPKRIYMIGMSNGGGGVWNYLIAHPEKIAAAVPVAASSFSYTGGAAGTLCTASSQDVAVWAIHNTNDGVVSPSYSTNGVTAWNNCAAKTKVAKYTGLAGTAFPADQNNHFTIEYVVNSQWVRYSPQPAVLDPTAVGRVPIESTVATELSNMGVATVEEWLLLHSKP